jgi:hypothetical protein
MWLSATGSGPGKGKNLSPGAKRWAARLLRNPRRQGIRPPAHAIILPHLPFVVNPAFSVGYTIFYLVILENYDMLLLPCLVRRGQMTNDNTEQDLERRFTSFDEVVQYILELQQACPEGFNPDIVQKVVEALFCFANEFRQRTKSPDEFITLSEIEGMISGLENKLTNQSMRLLHEELEFIDEKLIISKKKTEYLLKGIRLSNFCSVQRSIMTTAGLLTFSRMGLRPNKKSDRDNLK